MWRCGAKWTFRQRAYRIRIPDGCDGDSAVARATATAGYRWRPGLDRARLSVGRMRVCTRRPNNMPGPGLFGPWPLRGGSAQGLSRRQRPCGGGISRVFTVACLRAVQDHQVLVVWIRLGDPARLRLRTLSRLCFRLGRPSLNPAVVEPGDGRRRWPHEATQSCRNRGNAMAFARQVITRYCGPEIGVKSITD